MRKVYLVWRIISDYVNDLFPDYCDNLLEKIFDTEEKAIAYIHSVAGKDPVDREAVVQDWVTGGEAGIPLTRHLVILTYGEKELE